MEEQIQHLRETFGLDAISNQSSTTIGSDTDRTYSTASALPETDIAPSNVLATPEVSLDTALLDEFSKGL